MKLGEAISARRRAVGLSQKQLAEKVGVHDVTLSEWERGLRRPNATKLARVARELGLAVFELIGIAAGHRPVADLFLEGMELGASVADFVSGEDETAAGATQLPHEAYLAREELLLTLSRERRLSAYQQALARYLLSVPHIRQLIRETQGTLPTDQRLTDTMHDLIGLLRPSDRHEPRIKKSARRRSR